MYIYLEIRYLFVYILGETVSGCISSWRDDIWLYIYLERRYLAVIYLERRYLVEYYLDRQYLVVYIPGETVSG